MIRLSMAPGTALEVEHLGFINAGCVGCLNSEALFVEGGDAAVTLTNLEVTDSTAGEEVLTVIASEIVANGLHLARIITTTGEAAVFETAGFNYGDIHIDDLVVEAVHTWESPVGVKSGNAYVDAAFTVRHATFTNNTSQNAASALYFRATGPTTRILVDDVLFQGNRSENLAALTVTQSANGPTRLGLRDVAFLDNSSPNEPAIDVNTNFFPWTSQAWLSRVTFHRNVSDQGYGVFAPYRWFVRYDDVDFGVGPDNRPRPLRRRPRRQRLREDPPGDGRRVPLSPSAARGAVVACPGGVSVSKG